MLSYPQKKHFDLIPLLSYSSCCFKGCDSTLPTNTENYFNQWSVFAHAPSKGVKKECTTNNHHRIIITLVNATIVTGEYFSKQEQKNKKSYLTIGKLFIYQDGGMSLKLDAMPMQNQSISFYDIKPKSQPNQQPPQQNNYQQYQGN